MLPDTMWSSGTSSNPRVSGLNVHVDVARRRPIDRVIYVFDDLPVVLRDVILKVDHNQRFVLHAASSHFVSLFLDYNALLLTTLWQQFVLQ
jgi:hypothetical protein